MSELENRDDVKNDEGLEEFESDVMSIYIYL